MAKHVSAINKIHEPESFDAPGHSKVIKQLMREMKHTKDVRKKQVKALEKAELNNVVTW